MKLFKHIIILVALSSCSLPTNDAHKFNVYFLKFINNSNEFLSASGDNTMKLWTINGKSIKTFKHINQVDNFDVSPDNKIIISSDNENNIYLWHMNGNIIKTIYKAHDSTLRTLKFDKLGNYFYSGSEDNTLKIWNRDGILIKTLSFDGDVIDFDFDRDSSNLLIAIDNKILILNNNFQKKTVYRDTKTIYNIKYYDSNHIIASTENELHIFNKSYKLLNKFKTGDYWISGIVILNKSSSFITYGDSIKLWDLKGNLLNNFNDHFLEIYSVASNINENYIISGGCDFSIKIWSKNGLLLKTIWNYYHLRRFIWKYNPLDQWR